MISDVLRRNSVLTSLYLSGNAGNVSVRMNNTNQV